MSGLRFRAYCQTGKHFPGRRNNKLTIASRPYADSDSLRFICPKCQRRLEGAGVAGRQPKPLSLLSGLRLTCRVTRGPM